MNDTGRIHQTVNGADLSLDRLSDLGQLRCLGDIRDVGVATQLLRNLFRRISPKIDDNNAPSISHEHTAACFAYAAGASGDDNDFSTRLWNHEQQSPCRSRRITAPICNHRPRYAC
ncbi:MAG: hypothetical protein WCC91_04780 [Bradyrhizobium sp.]